VQACLQVDAFTPTVNVKVSRDKSRGQSRGWRHANHLVHLVIDLGILVARALGLDVADERIAVAIRQRLKPRQRFGVDETVRVPPALPALGDAAARARS